MKTKGHNSSKKRLVAALLCLCMLIGLMPGMGTAAFAASQYNIGDTVLFAGYEWYIIGTETEGVKAPEGCYTLFALDNVFGRTAFASSGESTDYIDSKLYEAINESDGAENLRGNSNIVVRETLDGISGNSPKNQILWPLSKAELEILPPSVLTFKTGLDYYTRTAVGEMVYAYDGFTNSIIEEDSFFERYCRPAMYVKASALTKKPNPATTELKYVAFGGQWWYVVGQGANGSVPGPENTVTLFESPSSPLQSSTDQEYMGSELQEQMADFASNLTLAGKESSLIVPRTLTVADEITGNPAENQPFWPLSKFEADSIGNAEILKAEEIDLLEYYWLRTTDPDGTDLVYAVNANDGSVDSYYARYYCGVRPAFYLDISNAFYLAKDAKKAVIGGNPYPLVLENYEQYKYTIFDGSLALSMTANPTQASQTGEKLSFGYVATTGENLYLACVLTADGDNNILYYNTLANLKESSASSGTVDIPLTGVTDGDYTLRLYTEQKNSRSTDFASPTVDVPITVNDGVASIRNLGDVQLVSGSGGQDGREVELRTNDTHIQWRYAGEDDDAWRDLVALDAITGGDGADGREVQLRVDSGYIQWKYDTDSQWTNLLALSDLKGDPGEDGREVELRTNEETRQIQWRYKGETEWKDLVALSDITGSDGADGKQVELRVEGGYIQWKYDADSDWQNLIALSALQGIKGDKGDKGDPGEDGREVELQNNGTSIQWRYKGETEWKDLVALSDITGSDGADGKQVELRVEGGYIQWKYDADSDWQNLIALSALQGIKGDKGDKGDPGEDGDTPYIGDNGNWWIGTTDTGIKASGTDGSNGSNGSDGKDGQDGKDGTDGLTPYVGSNGNWWIGTTDTGIKAAGTNGANGKNGTNGKNGADGVGIADIKLNENGELIITLTDGTENNLGKVKGEDGVGISGVSINENGELIVTLTNGTELNAGIVRTAETPAAMGSTEISHLKTLVYVSVGIASVSLAGLIGLLAFLLTRRKSLIGK
ncbi:hypothetical protein [Thermophilibacter provencensis]|uniref:Collagen-like protein n=1 Tax=Thermophilibacter provencensis TaxID=1852386 RepID=A0ABT7V2R2_9ACTN|nr:hypothetical protein [Thermophilibacter provencensis]MDM8270264.1 hypothetical protein [Thermophilibacter provencensis]